MSFSCGRWRSAIAGAQRSSWSSDRFAGPFAPPDAQDGSHTSMNSSRLPSDSVVSIDSRVSFISTPCRSAASGAHDRNTPVLRPTRRSSAAAACWAARRDASHGAKSPSH
jgi:hypothetical protein